MVRGYPSGSYVNTQAAKKTLLIVPVKFKTIFPSIDAESCVLRIVLRESGRDSKRDMTQTLIEREAIDHTV